EPTTGMVYWICPVEERKLGNVIHGDKRITAMAVSDQVIEVAVNDFKNLTHLIRRANRSLYKNFPAKNGTADKKVLWFTYPGFSDLAELPVWDKVIYDCS